MSGTPYALSDLELATRLSFFLWSSIPDDELLDVAALTELQRLTRGRLARDRRVDIAHRADGVAPSLASRGARHQAWH